MNQLALNCAFDASSFASLRIGRKALSRVRERRLIVATLADYTTREIGVEIDVDPERPFDVPAAIKGQFCEVPTTGQILEIKDRAVAVDGRRYRFTKIDKNGSFKLRKGW